MEKINFGEIPSKNLPSLRNSIEKKILGKYPFNMESFQKLDIFQT